MFRSKCSTLWAEPYLLRRPLTLLFIESACSHGTQCLPVPSSGTTWRDNTRWERSRERSFRHRRFSRERQALSVTTELFCATSPERVLSTCTKSTEPTRSAALSAKCTPKWLAATRLSLTRSRSFVLPLWPMLTWSVRRRSSWWTRISSSPKQTTANAHQPELWLPDLRRTAPHWSEQKKQSKSN